MDERILNILGAIGNAGADQAIRNQAITSARQKKEEAERKRQEREQELLRSRLIGTLDQGQAAEVAGGGDLLSIISGSQQQDQLLGDVELQVDNEPDPIKADDIIQSSELDSDQKLQLRGKLRQRIATNRESAPPPQKPSTVLNQLAPPESSFNEFAGAFRNRGTKDLLLDARRVFDSEAPDFNEVSGLLDAINKNPELAGGTLARKGKQLFDELSQQGELDILKKEKEIERDVRVDEERQKLELREEFTPPEEQPENVKKLQAQNEIAESLVARIEENRQSFGPVAGKYTEFVSFVSGGGWLSAELNSIGSTLFNLIDLHLRERSGAAVPPPEVERVMERVLGGFSTDPDALIARIKAFQGVNDILIRNLSTGEFVPFKERGMTDQQAIDEASLEFQGEMHNANKGEDSDTSAQIRAELERLGI